MCKMNNSQSLVTGKIKWFNQFKGYGFVEVDGVIDDVFLHYSTIAQSGLERLNNDDIILCKIEESGKGYQVSSIDKIIYLNKHETSDVTKSNVQAVVKWFNPVKGFGFANLSEEKEDVFIHSNLLKTKGIASLSSGDIVMLTIHETNFGYEAIDLQVKLSD